MSASPFRSHLLQHWARPCQGRTPAAVVPWLNKNSQPRRSSNQDVDSDSEEWRRSKRSHYRRHHGDNAITPPSISTLDSAASFGSSTASSTWQSHRSSNRAAPQSPTRSTSRHYSHSSSSRNALLPAESSAESAKSSRPRNAPPVRKVHSTPSSHQAAILEDEGSLTESVGTGTGNDEESRSNSQSLAVAVQSVLRERRTATRLKSADDSNGSKQQEKEQSLLEALNRAVQCAQMAPNHKRTEPFTFRRFLAGSQAAAQLADISYHVTLRKTNSHPHAEAKRKKWLDIEAFLVTMVHDNQRALEAPTGSDDNDRYEALPYAPPESERQLEDVSTKGNAVP
jgi:hypothetical protein